MSRSLTIAALVIAVVTACGSTTDGASSLPGAPLEIAEHHVATWAYWGQPGEDPAVDAAWLVNHVTYLETNATLGAKFRAAGGRFVVAYTDPVKVIDARHEPLWNLPDSAWFHDSSGERVGRTFGGWGVQHILNPASPVVQQAYAQLTRDIAEHPPDVFTQVLADDVSWDLLNVFYQAQAPGVEVASDAAYDSAMSQLLRTSALPVFFNGLGNSDAHLNDISGDVIFLDAAVGGMDEGCFYDVNGARTGAAWRFDANTLLYTTSHGKSAVCLDNMSGQDNVPVRMYYLASWWLTYDAVRSMAFPNLPSPGSIRVFPEFDIVPREPLETAHHSIDELATAGGAFGRRFAACYDDGKLIGACAAIVNPSALLPARAPAWATEYAERLVLDGNNSFRGGAVHWECASTPLILGPQAALVLRSPIGR